MNQEIINLIHEQLAKHEEKGNGAYGQIKSKWELSESIFRAFKRSDLCSDSVRELVKELYAYTEHDEQCGICNGAIQCTCGLDEIDNSELLYKITEASDGK